jgi:hypothetical protein
MIAAAPIGVAERTTRRADARVTSAALGGLALASLVVALG